MGIFDFESNKFAPQSSGEEGGSVEMPQYLKTKFRGQTATLVDMLIELNKEKHFKSADEALRVLFEHIDNIRIGGDEVAFNYIYRRLHAIFDGSFTNGHLDVDEFRKILSRDEENEDMWTVYTDYVVEKAVKIVEMMNNIRHYTDPRKVCDDFYRVTGGVNYCGPNPEDYYFSFAPYITRFFRRYVNQFWSEFAPNGTLDNALFRDFMIERHKRGIKKYGLEAVIRRNYKADNPSHHEVYSPYRGGAGPVYVETMDKQNMRKFVKSCGDGGPMSDDNQFERLLLKRLEGYKDW